MTAIVLYRIDPAKRMHRFYRFDVQPDLFGQMVSDARMGAHRSLGPDALRPPSYFAGSGRCTSAAPDRQGAQRVRA